MSITPRVATTSTFFFVLFPLELEDGRMVGSEFRGLRITSDKLEQSSSDYGTQARTIVKKIA